VFTIADLRLLSRVIAGATTGKAAGNFQVQQTFSTRTQQVLPIILPLKLSHFIAPEMHYVIIVKLL
jgi:hypothetical protein